MLVGSPSYLIQGFPRTKDTFSDGFYRPSANFGLHPARIPTQTAKTRVQKPENLKSGDRFLDGYIVFYGVLLLSGSKGSFSEQFPSIFCTL